MAPFNQPMIIMTSSDNRMTLSTGFSLRSRWFSLWGANRTHAHLGGLRGVDSSSAGGRQGCTCRTATARLLLHKLRISPGGSLETSEDRIKHVSCRDDKLQRLCSLVCVRHKKLGTECSRHGRERAINRKGIASEQQRNHKPIRAKHRSAPLSTPAY